MRRLLLLFIVVATFGGLLLEVEVETEDEDEDEDESRVTGGAGARGVGGRWCGWRRGDSFFKGLMVEA